MLVSGSRHPSSRARSAHLFPIVALPAMLGGGCTLLVGSELSEKPMEGADGQGGGPGSTASQSSSAAQSSSAQSTSAQSSTGTGWLMCKEGTADCDGFFLTGCEAKLRSDVKNCGECKHACAKGDKCEDGECE